MPFKDPERRREYDRKRDATPERRAARRKRDAAPKRRATRRAYNHSFRGVVRQYRYKDKQALARLEQQVKEGMESL